MNARGYLDDTGAWAIAPRMDGCGMGYLRRPGEYLVEPRYHDARPFRNGFAAVEMERRWGFVDHTGRLLIATQFVEVGEFAGGVAAGVGLCEWRRRRSRRFWQPFMKAPQIRILHRNHKTTSRGPMLR